MREKHRRGGSLHKVGGLFKRQNTVGREALMASNRLREAPSGCGEQLVNFYMSLLQFGGKLFFWHFGWP